MRRKQLFVFLSDFMWNDYACYLSGYDCVEVWRERKIELDFSEGDKGVERS